MACASIAGAPGLAPRALEVVEGVFALTHEDPREAARQEELGVVGAGELEVRERERRPVDERRERALRERDGGVREQQGGAARIARLERAIERALEVLPLGRDHVERRRGRPRAEARVVAGVALLEERGVREGRELLRREHAERLGQRVAALLAVADADERRLDEALEPAGHAQPVLRRRAAAVRGDGARRVEEEAAPEAGAGGEEARVLFAELLPGERERRADRSLAPLVLQEVEALGEELGDVVLGEGDEPRRRELERERDALELPDDRGHGPRVRGGDAETGAHRGRAAREELHGRARRDGVGLALARARDLERSYLEAVLGRDAEPPARGDDEHGAGRVAQPLREELREGHAASVDVVEDDDRATPRGERPPDAFGDGGRVGVRARREPERPRELVEEIGRRAHALEVARDDGLELPAPLLPDEVPGDGALADAGRAREDDEPVRVHRAPQREDLRVPESERLDGHRSTRVPA